MNYRQTVCGTYGMLIAITGHSEADLHAISSCSHRNPLEYSPYPLTTKRSHFMSADPSRLVTLADIEAAATRISSVAYRTPLIPHIRDGQDRAVFFKPELFQPMGAFKIRGAYNAIAALGPNVRRQGVIAYSSGNHAQGVAYAARQFGIPAVIVMPQDAPAAKIEGTRSYGAEVVLYDPATERREVRAQQLIESRGVAYTLIPPYDHHEVIAGQGTVGLEIVHDLPDVELVLACVGGGGLIAGIGTAIKALAPNAYVYGVEPEVADDARQSLESGQVVQIRPDQVAQTLADGVRTLAVSPLTLAQMQRYVDGILTVSEDELRSAARYMWLNAKLAIEPTAALPMAVYLYHRDRLPSTRNIVIVVTGGNADASVLADLLAMPDPVLDEFTN